MRFAPLLLLLTWLVGMPAGAAAPPPLVIIGVSGVSWQDVTPETTPHLAALARRSATGEMSVRAAYPIACPSDGWLTLGAGARAGDAGGCRELTPDQVPSAVTGAGAAYDPSLGELGVRLEEAGVSVLAAGGQSALALTDGRGTVHGTVADLDELAELAPGHEVILIDLGAAAPREEASRPRAERDPWSIWFTGPEPRATGEDMARLDQRLGEVLENLPEARIILASVADRDRAALRVVMDSGQRGVLTSASTHRPGLVQTIDLAPTIAAHVGADFAGPGRVLSAGEGSRPAIESATAWARAAQGPFFAAWVATFVLSLALASRRLMLAVSAVPAASVLAQILPWYRLPGEVPLFLVLVGLLATTIAFLAHALAERPAAKVSVISGLNLGVVGLLAAAASPLYLNSPLGSLPQEGGRFYGMTNMGFAVCSAAAILLTAALARMIDRVTAARWALAIGAALIIIDGVPSLGADVGGPPVLAPAFVLFAWLLAGRRLTPLALILAALAGILVPVGFAILDYLRPIDKRTHLGGFVADVVGGEGGATLYRKASQVLAQWPLLLLALALVAAIIAWWYRSGVGLSVVDPERYEVELWAALALAIITLGGALINDSGLVIPLLAAGQAPAWLMLRRSRLRAGDRRGRAGRAADPSHQPGTGGEPSPRAAAAD